MDWPLVAAWMERLALNEEQGHNGARPGNQRELFMGCFMQSYRIVSRGLGIVIDPGPGNRKPQAHWGATKRGERFRFSGSSQGGARQRPLDDSQAIHLAFPSWPVPSIRVGTPGLSSTAMELAISCERLRLAKIEEFEEAIPLDKRMSLPAVYAIVAENGSFAKLGATGYSSFVEKLHEASLFGSADAASKYISRWRVRGQDIPLAANARIAELAIGISASLNPATLAPSDNDATAMMRSLKER